jgi:4-diphosphocytidyl-2C-methyl-D-erythritol kinase
MTSVDLMKIRNTLVNSKITVNEDMIGTSVVFLNTVESVLTEAIFRFTEEKSKESEKPQTASGTKLYTVSELIETKAKFQSTINDIENILFKSTELDLRLNNRTKEILNTILEDEKLKYTRIKEVLDSAKVGVDI